MVATTPSLGGSELVGEGFAWSASRLLLERRVTGLRQQIRLQPSKFNRAGGSITVSAMLNVRDPLLARWRRAHSDSVVGSGDWVCGHLLGYASGRANGYVYGDATDGVLDLSAPDGRGDQLVGWVAMVREAVLPWFAEASDPDLAIRSRAGECTNSPASLVEWLASRGHLDLVAEYLDWYLSRHPDVREAMAQGRKLAQMGRLFGSAGEVALRLGWVAGKVLG